jgi:hypothetical protein
MDVIKTADWVIDLGPEGGDAGGKIIAKGTPEDIVKVKKSFTGQFLKKELELGKIRPEAKGEKDKRKRGKKDKRKTGNRISYDKCQSL